MSVHSADVFMEPGYGVCARSKSLLLEAFWLTTRVSDGGWPRFLGIQAFFMYRSDLGLPSVFVQLQSRSLHQCLNAFAFEMSQQFQLGGLQYELIFR